MLLLNSIQLMQLIEKHTGDKVDNLSIEVKNIGYDEIEQIYTISLHKAPVGFRLRSITDINTNNTRYLLRGKIITHITDLQEAFEDYYHKAFSLGLI